jgi:two-component system, LytTR family, sensor kinase
VRVEPDTAREVVVKLANILRSLLRKHDAFSDLREELAFIDDYLDIEVIRFGPDKLRVHKDLDPETLDFIVPSMLLQPLVENSIKHGLAPKIDGGSITIRSRIVDDKLVLDVQDDGVGIIGGSQAVFKGVVWRCGQHHHHYAGIRWRHAGPVGAAYTGD